MINEVKALLAKDFFTRLSYVLLDRAEVTKNGYLMSVAEAFTNIINVRDWETMTELMADEANRREYVEGQEQLDKFFEDNADELKAALHFDKILHIFEK